MASYLLRAPDPDMTRWKADAKANGVSFNRWIHHRLGAPPVSKTATVAPPEPESEGSTR